MTVRNAVHDTFTIERIYPVPPERVFKAWADPKQKTRWLHGPPEWGPNTFKSDFRVGGRETNSTGINPKTGVVHAFDAIYHDIVPNERIVFSYTMHLGTEKISVSLTTVEIKPVKEGTRLIFTEQGVYLDDYDDAGSRKAGSTVQLENIAEFLASEK